MDLCLECKACKAECPSQVDMAKMKYEFLNAYHQRHGYSMRERIFAHISALSSVGSALAPLTNWASGLPLTRWAMDRFLRIDKRRPMLPFARQSFASWFRSREKSADDGQSLGLVVLFNDTFMNFNYPSVGMAATKILEAAGFRVEVVERKCCGRPMISKGMLDAAQDNARYNVDLLYPYVEQGAYIVGCEPSCLLTLRDEYPNLLDDHKAKMVADKAMLLEEFLDMLNREGRLNLNFKDTPNSNPRKMLFHSHCHARALVGTAPSLAALRLAPGYEVEESNAGCCGMAGAFGYEKEHYDISMTIGGQRLFPAVSALDRGRRGGHFRHLLPPAGPARHGPHTPAPGGGVGGGAGVERQLNNSLVALRLGAFIVILNGAQRSEESNAYACKATVSPMKRFWIPRYARNDR